MNPKLKHHFWYHVSLFWVLTICLAFTYVLAYDKVLQMYSLFAATLFYIVWGCVHQHIHHHLTPKIVIEYTVIGSLGFAIAILLFQV